MGGGFGGFGTSGMSDYTSEFNGFRTAGNMPGKHLDIHIFLIYLSLVSTVSHSHLGGNRMSDLSDAEREFMGGGGFGRGGGMSGGGFGRGGGMGGGGGPRPGMRLDASGNMMPDMGKGFGSFRQNPSMQGRRIKVEGLQEDLKDEMIYRYFRKFGVVDDWKRDASGEFG